MSYEALWFKAFLITALVELTGGLIILYLLFAYDGRRPKPALIRESLLIISATGITHPPLWFILPPLCRYWGLSELDYLVIGESAVVTLEGIFYYYTLAPLKGHLLSGLVFSLVLNTLSYLCALIM